MTNRSLSTFEFKLGKLGLTLFIVGMSTLLFLVFALGVIVGRDIENLPGKIATDIPGVVKEKVGLAPAKTDNPPVQQPPLKEGAQEASLEKQPELNLTFYDTLGRKKGEEKGLLPDKDKALPGESKTAAEAVTRTPTEQKTAAAATTAAPAKKPETASPMDRKEKKAAAPPPEKKAVEKTASGMKSEAQKASSPTAKALESKGLVVADVGRAGKKTALATTNSARTEEKKEKTVETGGKFQIQVASYKEKGKADLIGKKVKFLGYKTRIVTADLGKKGKWHRVMVDGFESKEKAQRAAKNISGKIAGAKCVVLAGTPAKKNGR